MTDTNTTTGAAATSATIDIRRADTRPRTELGWLDGRHSFSFGSHYDPTNLGHGLLIVSNDDRVAPGGGFGTHGHRDMEIVSYVIEGALAHQDSMGNGTAGGAHAGVIQPGDVQRMSAGTGVRHSEFNHSREATTHFLQIWILPERAGIAPGYEQKHFSAESKRGRLVPVASRDGADGAVTIHADAAIHAGLFDGAERAERALDPTRLTYVHVVRGALDVNGERLQAGDAVTVRQEPMLVLSGGADAEVLVFDLSPRA